MFKACELDHRRSIIFLPARGDRGSCFADTNQKALCKRVYPLWSDRRGRCELAMPDSFGGVVREQLSGDNVRDGSAGGPDGNQGGLHHPTLLPTTVNYGFNRYR